METRFECGQLLVLWGSKRRMLGLDQCEMDTSKANSLAFICGLSASFAGTSCTGPEL